jgi:excisionase family DNA binding protein
MEKTLALYEHFEAKVGDPVAAASLTLAHAMMHQQVPEHFTVNEAAKRLKCSPKKVYNLCRGNELPHYRVGGSIRIRAEDLVRFSQPDEDRGRPGRRPKGPNPFFDL